MCIDTCFEIPEAVRTTYIKDNIVGKLPEEARENAKSRVDSIVTNYVGQDANALSILGYAAERGRFEEFAGKLEEHYRESLQYVHPEARKIVQVPGAVRAEKFFLHCYESMGIKPQQ